MKRKIRFARLTFERTLSYYDDDINIEEQRKDALLEVINFHTDVNELLRHTSHRSLRKRGDWHFGDVDVDDSVISARLGKETEETSRRRDPEKEGFVEIDHEDNEISFFVIDLSNSVIAYESRLHVGEKAPIWIIESAFNAYHEGKHELSISPIVDKEEVRKELARISRVTRVEFKKLTPTNPDRTPLSEPMDEFLRDGGIDKLNLDGISEFDESPAGINLENPLLNGGLSLAEEGYGSAEIRGKTTDGNDIRVTTETRQVESEVDEADSDRMYRQRIIQEIQETLDELEN